MYLRSLRSLRRVGPAVEHEPKVPEVPEVHYITQRMAQARCLASLSLTSPPHTSQVWFPGTSDMSQLEQIFRVLGAPSDDEWPEARTLPNFIPWRHMDVLPLG